MRNLLSLLVFAGLQSFSSYVWAQYGAEFLFSGIESTASSTATGAAVAGTADASTGAGLKHFCSHPGGAALCAMGVAAVAQAIPMFKSAGGARQISNQTVCTDVSCYYQNPPPGGGGQPGPTFPSTTEPENKNTNNGNHNGGGTRSPASLGDPNGNGPKGDDPLSKAIDRGLVQSQGLLNEYKELGYSYDPATNTIKTPSGKISPNSLASPDAMAAAGFSKQDIKNAQEELPKVLEQAGKDAARLAASLGGEHLSDDEVRAATNRGVAGAGGGSFDFAKYMAKMLATPNGGKGGKFAGLQKQISNGESIGVSGDNIFEMVTRKYKAKTIEGSFILTP